MLEPDVLNGGAYDTEGNREVSKAEYADAVMEWHEVVQFYTHKYQGLFTISMTEYYDVSSVIIDGWTMFHNMITQFKNSKANGT
jgi:hypothetical protein